MKKSRVLQKKKDSGFREKVVVVTGSSKGIGKVTALEFLKAGARVVINGRDKVMLEKTRSEFEGMGFMPFAVNGDMTEYDDCMNLIRETMDKFGRIDILVNNAGGGFRGTVEETKPEVFTKVIGTNLMSAVFCTKAAMEFIKAAKGSIVFISSLAGIRGLPSNGPYCIAKMGLTAFAQTLKLELFGSGVHIGIIMVGLTDFDENKRVVTADGSLIGISRQSHQTRAQVAKKILWTIKMRRYKVILTPLGKLNAFFEKFSPSLVEWIIRISGRRAKEYNN